MLSTILSSSPSSLFITACIIAFCALQVRSYQQHRKIIALGGYSARIKSRLPFGQGFHTSWKVIKAVKTNTLLELFEECFAQGHVKAPYTVDVMRGTSRAIMTTDSENIKAMLATQFKDFDKGEGVKKAWEPFLGHSIFSTDGKLWQDARTILRPQFAKDRIADLDTFERHVSILLELMLEQDGQEIDLMDFFSRFTIDAATDFLTGQSVNSLRDGQSGFAHSFGEIQRVQPLLSALSNSGLSFLYPRKEFNKHLEVLNNFINKYVDAALAIPKDELEKLSAGDHKYTLLHALAATNPDRKFLRDQLVATLLAGRDTTACTLSWLFYELGKNPHVYEALRKEVADVVGLGESAARPTYEQLKNMKYLSNTLSETLRHYPAIPVNQRSAIVDTTLPRGGGPDGLSPIGILKGTAVLYSTFGLQFQPEQYENSEIDPLRFEPDRWSDWHPKPWTNIPFSGGARICIGQNLALMEMSYTVVRILQTFSKLDVRDTIPDKQESEVGKLFFKNGKESLAWRKSRQNGIPLKVSIVLNPAEAIKMRFVKA